ncbi:MAG: hypothetical protein ACPGWR_08990, partial [Ardenticatenaceae bacterium]
MINKKPIHVKGLRKAIKGAGNVWANKIKLFIIHDYLNAFSYFYYNFLNPSKGLPATLLQSARAAKAHTCPAPLETNSYRQRFPSARQRFLGIRQRFP